MASLTTQETPAMQQYHRMKAEHKDALLFFRMGDFYEMFFDDAVVAAKALEIALTSRSKDKDGAPIPMCGVPHHAVTGYIARLVGQGFKVALCEQMEDPRTAKGVVKREVVRVITPGTQLDAAALESAEAAFVLALAPADDALGAAYLDASTGAFSVVEWRGPGAWERCRDDIGALRPRELVVPEAAPLPAWLTDPQQPESRIPRTALEPQAFDPKGGRRELLQHFGAVTLEAFGCESLPAGAAAAGAALRYVRETQKRPLSHVTGLVTRNVEDGLVIDALTRTNLELVESQADGGRAGTLLATLDGTRTPMGARLLKQWIVRPLLSIPEIQDRLDGVEELAFSTLAREGLRDALAPIQDIERLLGRATLGTAGPRDLLALARSLRAAPGAQAALSELLAPLLRRLLKDLEPPLDVADDAQPFASAPRVIARTAAFMPGASPPLVRTAIFFTRRILKGGHARPRPFSR